MSALVPSPKSFENETEALQWFWENAMIPRDFARHILAATGMKKVNPIFGSLDLLPEEILELLALSVALTLKMSLMNADRGYQSRKKAYQNYLKSAQILRDMGASIPAPNSASMWTFLIDGKAKKQSGRTKKGLREKIISRLIGFLEFSSGEETWASGEDPRVIPFLKGSLDILANALRQDSNPWYLKMGGQLLLPPTIRSVLESAKRRPTDLAFAAKIFWTLALMIYPAKVPATKVV